MKLHKKEFLIIFVTSSIIWVIQGGESRSGTRNKQVDLMKIVLFGILIIDGRTVLKCNLRKYCYSSGIGCSYQNTFRYHKFDF